VHDGHAVAGATQVGDELPPEVPSHWVVTFMADDADAFSDWALRRDR